MPSDPVYLDNAATTPMLPEVADAMRAVQVDHYGNPSSTHGFGGRPLRLLNDARDFMRGTFAAGRLVLTSGGSEADLLGVAGAALAREPGRVLVGAADHPAVLEQATLLKRLGHRYQTVPVGPTGVVDAERLREYLGPDVRVVALLHGHNELGSLVDLDTVVPLIRDRAPDAHIHLDLVQAYGKTPFELDAGGGVDSAAVSAHKFHGPRGVGCLALTHTARVQPIQPAGGQEGGLRGGTENVAGAVAMARAAETVLSDLTHQIAHARALAELFEGTIKSTFSQAERLGDADRRLEQIVSMRIPGLRGQTLQESLAAQGFAFSTGSACHGEDTESDNHVLAAIGLSRATAREVFRVSFARQTTRDQVERAARALVETARRLSGAAPTSPDRAPTAADTAQDGDS